MARLLVRAQHSQTTRYKTGMVITMFEDGHVWGRLETLPDFYQIDIPGVPVAEFEVFRTPLFRFVDGQRVGHRAIRRYELKPNFLATVPENGQMSTSKDSFLAGIIDKFPGEPS